MELVQSSMPASSAAKKGANTPWSVSNQMPTAVGQSRHIELIIDACPIASGENRALQDVLDHTLRAHCPIHSQSFIRQQLAVVVAV
jgi:hypothetical protein